MIDPTVIQPTFAFVKVSVHLSVLSAEIAEAVTGIDTRATMTGTVPSNGGATAALASELSDLSLSQSLTETDTSSSKEYEEFRRQHSRAFKRLRVALSLIDRYAAVDLEPPLWLVDLAFDSDVSKRAWESAMVSARRSLLWSLQSRKSCSQCSEKIEEPET